MNSPTSHFKTTKRSDRNRQAFKKSRSKESCTTKAYRELLLSKYLDSPNIKTRNELILLNLPLVYKIAHQLNRPDVFDDLVQEGIIGLTKAIERFNPIAGGGFGSYAYMFIWGHMTTFFRDKEKYFRVKGDSSKCLSLDTLIGDRRDGNSCTFLDNIPSPENPYSIDFIDLERGLEFLDEQSRNIIKLFYFKELSRSEIAEKLGISERQVKTKLASSKTTLKKDLAPRSTRRVPNT